MKAIHAVIITVVLSMVPASLFGQAFTRAVGEPNAEEIGVDTAQQSLREVSVTRFEDAGFWFSAMPSDEGLTVLRRLPGAPLEKQPIAGEIETGIMEQDQYVMGMKIHFYKRGINTFTLHPIRPLPVEGITKTLSVWVVGRNMNHVLKVLVADYFGNFLELTMGKLNFVGWKKMTVAIPPSLVQRDFHYGNRQGIKFLGFKIETDIAESFGTYYIYFDDLRAVTDLFSEESRDIDDIPDKW